MLRTALDGLDRRLEEKMQKKKESLWPEHSCTRSVEICMIIVTSEVTCIQWSGTVTIMLNRRILMTKKNQPFMLNATCQFESTVKWQMFSVTCGIVWWEKNNAQQFACF